MGVYWKTATALAGYWVMSWLLGTWLHLKSPDIWILRIGLALLGLAAASIFVWFRRRQQAASEPADGAESNATDSDDIDLLVREATQRLRRSRVGKTSTLASLPAIFVIGESGSAKTTTIVNSGLDPELLAGHVFQDSNILTTRAATLCSPRPAFFVDCGGELLKQPARWSRLVRLLRPGRSATASGKGQQRAPRAVVLCVSCENFFQAGAGEATVATAKQFRTRLQEICRILTISFPVYVLFTKLDRVPFFTDYVQNLTKEEASEVLGSTLPVRSQASGVYAEEETRRISKAFDELFYSLAEKRMDVLSRENDPDRRPNAYEFPRELRKARGLIADFLVNLGRPSQLEANPFIRGFYFSGVRPIVVDDAAPIAVDAAAAADSPADSGATRIFSAASIRQTVSPAAVRVAGGRRVPHWTFLNGLFHQVILKDRVALSASGFSHHANAVRRAVLAIVTGLALIGCVGFAISFVGNRALESEVLTAASEIPDVQIKGKQLPSLDALQRLDRLRGVLATLATYQQDGPPWRLRWGLYVGDRLYPQARTLYFARFHELLFAQTQDSLLAYLRGLPDSPGANDVYEKPYSALRAHLITTSNSDKSTVDFLSPVLLNYWMTGRDVDPARVDVAKRQFDFYSAQLPAGNPYSTSNDGTAVSLARNYLSKFGGIDRVYARLLAEASAKNPALSFNEQFRNASGVVNSDYKVGGPFTRSGFQFMQSAMRDPSSYMEGEKWVLGDQTATKLDPAVLRDQLWQRYSADFVDEWRNLLARSHVVPFGKYDADDKLSRLTSQTSPLFELLWFVSNSTNVGVPALADPFAPVQAVEPPGEPNKLPDQYIFPSNREYITALSKLQADLKLFLNDPTMAGDASRSAAAAEVAVSQVMGPRVDQRFHTENTVRRLLEEPILSAEQLVNSAPKDSLNRAGQQFCHQFDQITRGAFPFDPSSSRDLPMGALNQLLAPNSGAIWNLYNDPAAKLSTYLVRQGSRYQPTGSGNIRISPAFVEFFNRMAGLSNALYADGSSTPKFTYHMGRLATDVDGLTVTVGSQSIGASDSMKTFTWTGNEDVQVAAKGAPYGSYSGPWAVFRFVTGASWRDMGPGQAELERRMESNGQISHLPDGRVMFYRYQLEVAGPNPFRPSEWSGMRCVSQVAH